MRKAKLYVSDNALDSENTPPRATIRPPFSVFRTPIGGARRDRTDDLMLAKHALYQLSYGPLIHKEASSLGAVIQNRCLYPRMW